MKTLRWVAMTGVLLMGAGTLAQGPAKEEALDIGIASVADYQIHDGAYGLFGSTTGWRPDPVGDGEGMWVEGTSGGESGGFFANGNCAVIWSPGDADILRVYDEDRLPSGEPAFVINGYGRVGIGNPTPEARLDVIADTNKPALLGVNNQDEGIGVSGDGDLLGVRGYSGAGAGISGYSPLGYGVFGSSTFLGYAGYFDGDVKVIGRLTKSSGSFKIDHPLDPENKYLQHSFVESPDMMNIYNGCTVLDASGEASVTLPDWFEALNKDFRYQLTCIGGFAPVYIAEKVAHNRFKIAGGKPGMEVSWQVTGVRRDPYADQCRIAVEESKPAAERGLYLHPEAYGLPRDKSIQMARRIPGHPVRQLARAEAVGRSPQP